MIFNSCSDIMFSELTIFPQEYEMDKQNERDYYTLQEAMNILGMKKSKFYDDVDAGKIPFELPTGKRIGMRFPKEGIDILMKRKHKKRSQKQTLRLTFEPSTISDIWTAVNNARQLYGSNDVISFERALEWRDVNPDISMSVKQEKLFVGMVTYLPLDEQIILAICEMICGSKISPIKLFDSGQIHRFLFT